MYCNWGHSGQSLRRCEAERAKPKGQGGPWVVVYAKMWNSYLGQATSHVVYQQHGYRGGDAQSLGAHTRTWPKHLAGLWEPVCVALLGFNLALV